MEFESVLCGKCATRENQCTCVPTIKLRPDNTVIISFTKKTYSREELEQKLKDLAIAMYKSQSNEVSFDVLKWIKEN